LTPLSQATCETNLGSFWGPFWDSFGTHLMLIFGTQFWVNFNFYLINYFFI